MISLLAHRRACDHITASLHPIIGPTPREQPRRRNLPSQGLPNSPRALRTRTVKTKCASTSKSITELKDHYGWCH